MQDAKLYLLKVVGIVTKYLHAQWNVTTGCSVLSETCEICLIGPHTEHYSKYDPLFKNKLTPTLHEKNLQLPVDWQQPRIIEVSPYSDLFNPAFPSDFIKKVFAVIEDTPRHIYLLTTKYPGRAAKAANIIGWPNNLWTGTSIEMNKYMHRMDDLDCIPAMVKFLEFQPLLEKIEPFELINNVDWVAVKADITETKPFDVSWIQHIREACAENGAVLFAKDPNNNYPKLESVDTFWFTLSIDNDKTPITWTIDYKTTAFK